MLFKWREKSPFLVFSGIPFLYFKGCRSRGAREGGGAIAPVKELLNTNGSSTTQLKMSMYVTELN